jgi:alanyl-tRNA synthetase
VTVRLYQEDPYLLDFDGRVLARREREGRPAVVLDRTAFYPESGGQPWDTGTLDGVPVLAAIEHGEEVLHVLAAPLAADAVHGRVDGDRRRDHRQQHHGQHLLSRAFVELHRAETVGFHLGSESTTIDLAREVSEKQVAAAATRANEIVWEARPVRCYTSGRAEALASGIDLKDAVGEAVRVVEVEGFDRQPCCGTHPRTTAEVGVILVSGAERYKGGTRVSFLCGHRAQRAFEAQVAVLAQLSGTLSARASELAAAAGQLKERLREEQQRSKGLLGLALRAEARLLLDACPAAPKVVRAAFAGRPLDEVRALAGLLVELEPCAALLGTRGDKAQLVFAAQEGLPIDVQALMRDAVALLGGRGGGRGNLAQGGGDRLDRLDEALLHAEAAARAALAPRP